MKTIKKYKYFGINKDGITVFSTTKLCWHDDSFWQSNGSMYFISIKSWLFSALVNVEEFKPGQLYKINYKTNEFELIEEK